VWSSIDFKDNQPILDVLEGQGSLLALLDEECRLQSGSDDTFVQKLRQAGKRGTVVTADGASVDVLTFPKRTQEPEFILRHYAGYVRYSADNFRDKNKDAVHPQLLELLQRGSPFVSNLFPASNTVPSSTGSGSRRGGSKLVTLGSSFKEQLTSLVATINSTTVHYVRCIKPNFEKAADQFDLAGVSSQLRCQGILEAIRISRAAYPNRLRHHQLLQRYSLCVHDESLRKEHEATPASSFERVGDGLIGATNLLAALQLDPSLPGGNYQVGKTKCFMKRSAMEKLEASRGRVLAWFCIRIQADTRAWLGRLRYTRVRRGVALVQRVGRGMLARARARQERAAITLQAIARAALAAQQHARTLAGFIALQSLARGVAARRAAVTLRRSVAATRIQASFLRWAGARQFMRQRAAATIIQREARRRIHVVRYRSMRDEAREEASLYGQIAKLKNQLHVECERRTRAEAENSLLKQRLGNEGSNHATPAAGSSSHVIAGTPPGVATLASPGEQPRMDESRRPASPSPGRTLVAGVAVAPVPTPSALAGVNSPAGWFEGILSGGAKTSSYSESEIETIDRERMMLKRKLSTEARNMQRVVDEKDKKIKELQRRDLRASRKSAQETGMLHEERKKNTQLQNDLRKEIELARFVELVIWRVLLPSWTAHL
jgi:myosin-5